MLPLCLVYYLGYSFDPPIAYPAFAVLLIGSLAGAWKFYRPDDHNLAAYFLVMAFMMLFAEFFVSAPLSLATVGILLIGAIILVSRGRKATQSSKDTVEAAPSNDTTHPPTIG